MLSLYYRALQLFEKWGVGLGEGREGECSSERQWEHPGRWSAFQPSLEYCCSWRGLCHIVAGPARKELSG